MIITASKLTAFFNLMAKDGPISLYLEVIHEIVVVATEFIGIKLFAKVIFYVIFVALKGGNDVGDIGFINADRHPHHTSIRVIESIKLGNLCIICFQDLAKFIK